MDERKSDVIALLCVSVVQVVDLLEGRLFYTLHGHQVSAVVTMVICAHAGPGSELAVMQTSYSMNYGKRKGPISYEL